ncbi:energy-coupling factor ABC transporter substrate-binding protein [Clostridium kluyveri]|uniref:energy-coupling factor ABC transporter substrate-binding protein n=1 Tax=Clostridium kluyveri TaxID=1534 RepID=UPI0022469A55|nr:energy-coupling factor ABC transporter substrate-binding protein [Clostridium kluyveri]UZQ51895.1 energy-coupling factor ABC transporter substrate-binding protein [Clostridium kluyveri]
MNIEGKNKNNSVFKKNLILCFLVIAIAVIPLIFLKNAEFAGSDDKAEKAITQIDKSYKPWFSSIWQPPSAEIESLLFSLQAAVGSGIVCYYFGYLKGKSKKDESEKS